MPGSEGERAWRDQADRVAEVCRARLPGLVGVYVHGSAALGGFGVASDVDVVVVAGGHGDWRALGAQLLAECGHPRVLELSVVEASACALPSAPWPYLLHVNSGDSRVTLDEGNGDADLIAHYAVTRAVGVTIIGPAPEAVFGPVRRRQLVAYLRDELRWAIENADQRYAVLNACRAAAYCCDGLLLSKPAGGRWWLRRYGAEPLVEEALIAHQEGRDIGRCTPAARSFVAGQRLQAGGIAPHLVHRPQR